MSNTNVCIFDGRLTKNPILRYNGKGTAICTFTLAVNRVGNGADFPRITIFGKAAETAKEYLAKGRWVSVTCALHTGNYEDSDGNTVWVTEFRTTSFRFGPKNGGSNNGNQVEPDGNNTSNEGDNSEIEDLDDLPNF
jgi:single-strand DNA-binding protein